VCAMAARVQLRPGRVKLVLRPGRLFSLIPFRAARGLFVFGAFRAENTIDMTSASFEAVTSLGEETF
jgi:hypothetical protein